MNKGSQPEMLLTAIQQVLAGGRYVSPEYIEQMANSVATGKPVSLHDSLSEKEYEILVKLAQGMRITDIAQQLGSSPNTISTFKSRVLAKLKLKSNQDLVRYAIDNNLIRTT